MPYKNLSAVKIALVIMSVNLLPVANAAVSLDRTRVIFNGGEKSMTLKIANDNTQLPYLAQAWLEDKDQKKITTGPIVLTPPVQRLEPGAKSMIRLNTTPDISRLPQDRESLFFFNLREIPPKSDKANVLQIALQTKIKLFYRPDSIKSKMNEVWQDRLVLHKSTGGYRIENPTPYFVTIIGVGDSETKAKTGKFDAVMISPKSDAKVTVPHSANVWLTYINDYGGRPAIQFSCGASTCTAVKK